MNWKGLCGAGALTLLFVSGVYAISGTAQAGTIEYLAVSVLPGTATNLTDTLKKHAAEGWELAATTQIVGTASGSDWTPAPVLIFKRQSK